MVQWYARDMGLVPGSGRSPGIGNVNPLQYSWLGSAMDREAWRATIHGITKSWTWRSKWRREHTQHKNNPTACAEYNPFARGLSTSLANNCFKLFENPLQRRGAYSRFENLLWLWSHFWPKHGQNHKKWHLVTKIISMAYNLLFPTHWDWPDVLQ